MRVTKLSHQQQSSRKTTMKQGTQHIRKGNSQKLSEKKICKRAELRRNCQSKGC